MSTDVKLGQLISGSEGRDAIHIAIAPVIAGESLKPGDHIGFLDEHKEYVGKVDNPIGIVDPFLKNDVNVNDIFYMCLYPYTITTLRHEWEHPEFKFANPDLSKKESERWLRDFARGCHTTYDNLISGMESGDLCVGTETFEGEDYDKIELFHHYEVVTGVRHTPEFKKNFYIRCAC